MNVSEEQAERAAPDESLAVRASADDAAYQDFLRRAKQFWARDAYAAVRRAYGRLASATDGAALDADAIEKALATDPTYRAYSWLERHVQRSKYASPRGIVAIVDGQRRALTSALDEAAAAEAAAGRLRLDPDLELPRYYSAVEFHQHPGGVWRDPLAGCMYDFGRNTTLPEAISPEDIHERFASAAPDGDFERILDAGCGTGRSTLPFARRFPRARLYGVDLSVPCLRRAAQRARTAGVPVEWSQQSIERTDFPDAHFDVIHSTFLLHELPRQAIEEFTREALRLLRPRGWFVHLDFQAPPGGPFGEFVHFGHARRNDEPFMRSFCELDFLGLQRRMGFAYADRRAFDDGSGLYGPTEVPPVWRFPSQLFVARK